MIDKSLKNRTILAYAHNMMLDGEEQKEQGKGTIIIDDEVKREYSISQGKKLIKYCEDNGCTRDSIEKLALLNHGMLLRAKKYYGKIIKLYTEVFKERHIPLLFATIVFQKLENQGYLKMDIDYVKLFNTINESDYLEKETKKSVFSGKEIVVNKESNTYSQCVENIFVEVYKIKPSDARRKRKKR